MEPHTKFVQFVSLRLGTNTLTTYQFNPIDDVMVAIMVEKLKTSNGLERSVLYSAMGPWGNTSRIEKGEDQLTPGYEDLLDEALKIADKLCKYNDGKMKNYWSAPEHVL